MALAGTSATARAQTSTPASIDEREDVVSAAPASDVEASTPAPHGLASSGTVSAGVPSAAPSATPSPSPPGTTVSSADEPETTATSSVANDPKTEEKPILPFEVSGGPGNGLTVSLGNAFSLNVRSRIQVRADWTIPQDESIQQMLSIGTARLWFSGHVLHPSVTYMIQLAVAGRDYRENTPSPLYDAYVDWKPHRDIHLRAGQFFVPFDRLRTVREWALQMVNRPIPVGELTLDRDVGVVAYSERFLGDRSPVAWRVGVFGGGGTNLTRGKPPGALVVARLEVRPLGPIDDDIEGDLERRRRPALALGIGGAGNFNTNRLRSTTGPTFAGGTTTYGHATADLVFKVRGLAIQGEYLLKQARDHTIASVTDEGEALTEFTRSGQGWVAQVSYVFDPPIEIVARLSASYAFRGTDPTWREDVRLRGQEVGAGLNYYINGHKFKIQAGWIARMPRDFEIASADHLVAAQLDMTF